MLETVVRGCVVLALTRLPTRNGISPTTPSDGLEMVQKLNWSLAFVSWACAAASCAFSPSRELTAMS